MIGKLGDVDPREHKKVLIRRKPSLYCSIVGKNTLLRNVERTRVRFSGTDGNKYSINLVSWVVRVDREVTHLVPVPLHFSGSSPAKNSEQEAKMNISCTLYVYMKGRLQRTYSDELRREEAQTILDVESEVPTYRC